MPGAAGSSERVEDELAWLAALGDQLAQEDDGLLGG
jgi:hypothetical protein